MSTRSGSDDRHGKPVVILDPDDGTPLVIVMPNTDRQTAEALLAEAARATLNGKRR